MTSDKQVQANRRNALESTGPNTPEGKASVRHNAIKHGLLSRDTLLPNEDEAALDELGKSLRTELQPMGEMENLLVERIVSATWRLRRLGRVEAGIFAWELFAERADQARKQASTYKKYMYDALQDENFIITDDTKYQEALSKADKMEAEQEAETATLGRSFIRDAEKTDAFSKLSRYETTIERSLYKALHELQRLQAARRVEGSVPPPVAVDVDVSGVSREDL